VAEVGSLSAATAVIGLIQRVSTARVTVGEETVGSICQGLLALVAVQPGDTADVARQLIERIVAYRVFDDAAGKMNLSLADVGGELLLVSQFTLAAVDYARAALPGRIATGRFGADMQVALVNDGPVTFWLQIPTTGATE
jgi:D-tyrosyl-tRNA(Tyr) deacylase